MYYYNETVFDAVDLVPFVSGVGECIKGAKATAKMSDKVDDAIDMAKAGCFVAGTKIKTKDGSENIEEIEVGDLVYAKNEKTGETGWKRVAKLFEKEATELVHLEIGDTKITTTPTHPFWVAGHGFMEAGRLAEGNYVETADGRILRVNKAETEYPEKPVTVYNFEVEDWHTYFVSEEEVFVHNMCSVTPIKGGKASVVIDNSNNITKPDFIVTPNGTVMDTSKNYNLIGTGEKGDWFQIHNFGKAEPGFDFPHTHTPQMNTNGVHTSVNRVVSNTSADDIDYANELLSNGIMSIRKGKR